jgi:hypothetical protein
MNVLKILAKPLRHFPAIGHGLAIVPFGKLDGLNGNRRKILGSAISGICRMLTNVLRHEFVLVVDG